MAELAPIADRFKNTGLDIRSHLTPNTVTDTAYTATADDQFRMVQFNNASAQTVTIPPRSSVPFDQNSVLTFYQIGAGTVTVVAGSGVTLRSAQGGSTNASKGQYAIFQVICVGDDIWQLAGGVN